VGDDADLHTLELERSRLKSLAAQLQQKAQALEQRAAQLK
jgi:hypothetical protein